MSFGDGLLHKLIREEAHKFRLEQIDEPKIKEILSNKNGMGIINMPSSMNLEERENLKDYLEKNYPDYLFGMDKSPNPEIAFIKREHKNKN